MTAIELMLDHYGVLLRGSTSEQTMCCPVHDENRASATVNVDKGVFHCFACGAAGSVYDMVMLREKVDYQTARRFVEEVTGIADAGSGKVARPRAPVPPGTGYRPRARKKLPAGSRQRLEF